jgi:hypothetical protein
VSSTNCGKHKNIVFKIAKNRKMESLQKMIERTLVCLCICVSIFVVAKADYMKSQITNHNKNNYSNF